MISPSKLMERMGAGARLAAFFKAVCVYFAVCGGADGAGGAEGATLAAVAAKCAPVLCLLLAVLLHRARLPPHHPRRQYCARVMVGLAASCAGDALLVWPQHFVWGMGAFAGAHAAYIAAFGWRPLAPGAGAALLGGAALYAVAVPAEGALRPLVPLYALLLATMAWRGMALPAPSTTPYLSPAGVGAALFLVSDAALGYSMFKHPLPYRQVIVMSTYYLAQLGIALSALETPAPGESDVTGGQHRAAPAQAPAAAPVK